ncbi:hypothetical protein [Paractinoplanes atraurantiacus]|uniref:Uncharacterized protein n=1 Tax=Paractinoplanes atraurantiacus TaxID=1036182 RepID=A0A285JD96_9ACTN|nr:hypothetical protein [Actinoplanes atraurantiacus]SNY58232.1 hypothetical protein SAMN05421748_11940 [Actinoplanes atraurantiacus]
MSQHDKPPAEEPVLGPILRHLQRNSEDERIRELAAGVLNGEVSLREALTADAYADALRPGLVNFTRWRQQQGDDTLVELIEQNRAQIEG